MAEAKKTAGRRGATPKKLALVAVLGVVLVTVIYIQFGRSAGDDAQPAVAAAGGGPKTEPAAGKATPAGVQTSAAISTDKKEWLLEPINRPAWKKPELAQIVRYDPFALPAAFPQPPGATVVGATTPDGVVAAVSTESAEDLRTKELAEIQSKLSTLKQRGVRVIIDGRKQAAAIVGDRTIHVGDDIEGFTVTAIDSDGVVVERKLD